MQRKFLEDLGLEKDVIDRIMSENGKDIESTKHRLEVERDNYKDSLETAQKALKEFEGVDVKELNGRITQLTADLAKKDSDYQAKIANMEFNSVLDSAISESKAKNSKALKALLDVESLKSSKNRAEDIRKAIEAVKAENDYLFESAEPIKNPVKPTNNPSVAGITKETFAKMGYADRLNLKKTNPEKYAELKGE